MYYTHRSSVAALLLILIYVIILGTWKVGIMLGSTVCINIIMSPLLHYGHVTQDFNLLSYCLKPEFRSGHSSCSATKQNNVFVFCTRRATSTAY